jgi:hypothetical protein
MEREGQDIAAGFKIVIFFLPWRGEICPGRMSTLASRESGPDIHSPRFMSAPSASAPSPYAEFQAELAEIHRHKWLVSEREGRDVGFERALTEWVEEYRPKWRRQRNLRQNGKKQA